MREIQLAKEYLGWRLECCGSQALTTRDTQQLRDLADSSIG